MTTFALHTVERKPHPLLYQSNLSICKYTVLIHHIHTKCTAKAPSRYLSLHTLTPTLYTLPLPHLLQTSLILLYLCIAAGTPLGDHVGQLFGHGILPHTFVEPSSFHPLGHVYTAGWLVSLHGCVYRFLITTSLSKQTSHQTDNIPGTIPRTSWTHNKVTLHNPKGPLF